MDPIRVAVSLIGPKKMHALSGVCIFILSGTGITF